MRNIVVDNVAWRYKVGKSHLVAQQPDTKKKLLIQLSRLLGYDSQSYEKDSRNRSYYTRITPKLIADYIRHSDWYSTAELMDIVKVREKQLMPENRPFRSDRWCDTCMEWHSC
jgi:hypothetical protein